MDAESSLILGEASARRLLLVQAIDTADPQGRLIGAAERDPVEQQALQATGDPAQGRPLDTSAYLQARAQGLLALAERRQPAVAALQHRGGWSRWLAWGLPAAALLLGAGIDRIDNPGQVNLLSPPLLAFVFWNLAVYLLLVAGWLWRGRRGAASGGLPRWLAGQARTRTGRLRADVQAEFTRLWWGAAGRLEGQRWRAVLHASAACWAVGVGLSIVLGGLVREYRVGWESTLLEAPQVHAFLQALFAPVVAVLPLEGFTLAELERMHFRSGVEVARSEARHWIALYLALLGLLVVLPRGVLASVAAWRRVRMAHRVRIALDQPYFREVLGRVSPARVVLCLLGTDADGRATLEQVLRQASERHDARWEPPWTAVTTVRGDALCWMVLPQEGAMVPAAAGAALPAPSWWQPARWRRGPAPLRPAVADLARQQTDVVLCTVAGEVEFQRLRPTLQWLGKPVLLLAGGPPLDAGTEASLRGGLQGLGGSGQLLQLAQTTRHWLQEQRLREAITALLPAHKAAGMARISQAWAARHEARLAEAMRLLAAELVQAAREAQDVGSGPMDLRRLVRPAEREAAQRALEAASAAVLERLRERHAAVGAELLRLHGLADEQLAAVEADLGRDLQLRQAIAAPQAGMAGAASGAALGATVDLMVGGLTLGAAAALGALVGGGAAAAAAAWKNRTSPSGATLVQPSDEMLLGLTEAGLLRYLAVVQVGRPHATHAASACRSEVVAAVVAERSALAALWAQARAADAGALPVPALTQLLQRLALTLLQRL